MEDTVFACKLSDKPAPSQFCVWPQQDTHGFGPRLWIGFEPPRKCQCARCTLYRIATGERNSVSGVYGFCMWESHCSRKCSMHACKHTHNRYTDTYTLSRPQKISRLDRKFWSRMAVQTGLKVKIYRTPMLTTRAQCGGRTCNHSRVAKMLISRLDRMADTCSLFRLSYHQAPWWTFLYA